MENLFLVNILHAYDHKNLHTNKNNKSRRLTTGLEGLCILLRRLSYPNRLYDLVKTFQRDVSALSRIILWTLNFIYENFSHLLKTLRQPWLSKPNLYNFADVSCKLLKK